MAQINIGSSALRNAANKLQSSIEEMNTVVAAIGIVASDIPNGWSSPETQVYIEKLEELSNRVKLLSERVSRVQTRLRSKANEVEQLEREQAALLTQKGLTSGGGKSGGVGAF